MEAQVQDKKKGKSEDKKRRILKAAVKVFAERGYHDCRISEIAEEAGVAYGLVYHYYGSKNQLLAQIFDRSWGGFRKAINQVTETGANPKETIRQVIEFLLTAFEIDPLLTKVIVLEFGRGSRLGEALDNPEVIAVFDLVTRIFEAAKTDGSLAQGVESRAATVLFIGAMESALTSFVIPVQMAGIGADSAAIEGMRSTLHATFTDGLFIN
jgi:TetR/AcrR family fatty acid metabolism transcriptional regulator